MVSNVSFVCGIGGYPNHIDWVYYYTSDLPLYIWRIYDITISNCDANDCVNTRYTILSYDYHDSKMSK